MNIALLCWAEDMVYPINDQGFAVVECENLDYNSAWGFKNSPEGYTGTGYLRANKSRGVGHTFDPNCSYQGPMEDRLLWNIFIPTGGRYAFDVHNIHWSTDGDNDVWMHVLGYDAGCMRGTDGEAGSFSWLTWQQHMGRGRSFELDRGMHTFYLAPRSAGFSVDRIICYDYLDPRSVRVAQDISQPETEAVALSEAETIPAKEIPDGRDPTAVDLSDADNTSVFKEIHGIVKVEVERYKPRGWKLETSQSGYSGEGYLTWVGRNQAYNNVHTLPADQSIGNSSEYIEINFRIINPGTYYINLRCTHDEVNGDHTIWIKYAEDDNEWYRAGSWEQSIGRFGWLRWGINAEELQKGTYTVRLAGSLTGFGVDYVVVFRDDKEDVVYDYLAHESPVDDGTDNQPVGIVVQQHHPVINTQNTQRHPGVLFSLNGARIAAHTDRLSIEQLSTTSNGAAGLYILCEKGCRFRPVFIDK
jgi:hypothetical protein